MEILNAPLVQRLGYEPSKLETRVRLPDGAKKRARQMITLKSDIIQFFCSQTIENDHTSRSV